MENISEMILVVDDDEAVRGLIVRFLERDGHRYREAGSAEEALQLLERENFSLLISDINMPGKTGLDLLKEVQGNQPDLAVIMATAVDDRDVAIESLFMGAYGYMTKPFNRNELSINVTKALRRRQLKIGNRAHSEKLEALVSARTEE